MVNVQQKIDIKEIRDDVVVLKSGGLRAVLMTSSVNFLLKSQEEQDAIIYRFQDFLNSLEFSIQILMTARKFDISNYVQMLQQHYREQQSELLQIQTAEYIDFIKGLAELTNIMTDSFYIVVPFAPIETKASEGILKKFTGLWKTKKEPAIKEQNFEQMKTQLWQRVDYLKGGLAAMGLNAVPLNNEQLLELFYKMYNPGAKEKPVLPEERQALEGTQEIMTG